MTISSVVWIQYTNVTDGQTRRTDRHRATAKTALKHRSHGKKDKDSTKEAFNIRRELLWEILTLPLRKANDERVL